MKKNLIDSLMKKPLNVLRGQWKEPKYLIVGRKCLLANTYKGKTEK